MAAQAEEDEDTDTDHENESDDGLVDVVSFGDETGLLKATIEERFVNTIQTLREFCDGLEYQVQFNDQRMLDTVERESASCLRLARSCLDREHQFNSTRTSTPRTWEKNTISAMFYRPRPRRADEGT